MKTEMKLHALKKTFGRTLIAWSEIPYWQEQLNKIFIWQQHVTE